MRAAGSAADSAKLGSFSLSGPAALAGGSAGTLVITTGTDGNLALQLSPDNTATLDPKIELDRFGSAVRSVQEPARIAWNLSTTVYFKGARVQPWQLADVRPRVQRVGVVLPLRVHAPSMTGGVGAGKQPAGATGSF